MKANASLAIKTDSTRECPVCEYPSSKPRYELTDRFFKTTKEHFLLYQCRSCGLLFQDQDQVQDRLSEFYPSGYWWESNGTVSSFERFYRENVIRLDHLRFLKSIFRPPRNLRLLDIGCGSGAFVKVAREAGFDAYGLESSPTAVRLAEKEVPGCIFSGSEEQLIEREEKFDIVVLFHCLEHIPNPFRYLKRLQNLLNRPGSLIVQVPNLASWQAKLLGSRWYGLDCPRHVCNYTSYSLLHLLSRSGYRIQRLRYFSLRDNAPALVSSIFPSLDPISQRVAGEKEGSHPTLTLALKEMLYLNLTLLVQPFVWLEARLGKGATLTVHCTLDR
ncbi:MAG TPA: class I SAM-dependent methyltransferase [Acidobacteriota bacterium]|nr:class I SAM-dependent methyltransferase [Acidobacteriota bacterium]